MSKKKVKKKDIICFGEDWYSPSMGITKQVMRVLNNKGHRVFWINPIPYRMPKVGTKSFKRRFSYKLRSHMKFVNHVNDKQLTFCPFYIPLVENEFIDKLNVLLLNIQLNILKIVFNVRDPVYWGTGYTISGVLEQIKDSPLTYNFCDKYSSHRGISEALKTKLEEKDKELTERSDLVLCSSKKIFDYVKSITNNKQKVIYFPHGVDFQHFNKANDPALPIPDDMAAIKHPIVGYFGTLGGGFNKEIIKFCASKRPDWSFVLIGAIGAENDELRKLRNVYLLGPKYYSDIPYYGRCFDICLMTWTPHEWADFCFPIKTLEYLAMGKPVVSIPIEEITRNYSDVVRLAYGNEEFLWHIENELNIDNEKSRIRRIEKVKDLTWEKKVDSIYGKIVRKI